MSIRDHLVTCNEDRKIYLLWKYKVEYHEQYLNPQSTSTLKTINNNTRRNISHYQPYYESHYRYKYTITNKQTPKTTHLNLNYTKLQKFYCPHDYVFYLLFALFFRSTSVVCPLLYSLSTPRLAKDTKLTTMTMCST